MAARINPADERLLRRVAALIGALSAAGALIAAVLGGADWAAGVAAGGLASAVNLLWIAALVRRLLEGSGNPRSFGLQLAGKELLILAGLGVLIITRAAHPVGLLIGLSGLVVSIVAVMFGSRRAPEAPGMDSKKE